MKHDWKRDESTVTGIGLNGIVFQCEGCGVRVRVYKVVPNGKLWREDPEELQKLEIDPDCDVQNVVEIMES
jgi:hypothetical protein